MLNRILSLIMLLLLSPIFIMVALLIFFEDGFPVFFKQNRVGINYSFFNIYKFRSMKKNTPNVATHLLTNPEQYVLKIGRLLRKLSLDELPNLINGCITFIKRCLTASRVCECMQRTTQLFFRTTGSAL